MRPVALDRRASRQLDRRAMDEYGLAGIVLMENAGRGAADLLDRLDGSGKVVIVCGKGNNAGDGFVMARHLDLRKRSVRVVLLALPDQLTGDAGTNLRILGKTGVPIDQLIGPPDGGRLRDLLAGADWVVDGLLGTGARGAPRGPYDRAIEACNQTTARRLALDLPSGLDCDTGEAPGAVFHADHTCTFATWKSGFLYPRAARFTGEIHVADIGAPRQLIERMLHEAATEGTGRS